MAGELSDIRQPELVFGIAGPIGIEIDEIVTSLTNELSIVNYNTSLVRVTDVIRDQESGVKPPDSRDYFSVMQYKMDHASALCRKLGHADALMRYAIIEIKDIRIKMQQGCEATDQDLSEHPSKRPLSRMAYIVRQLKRPEEVELMRRVYGRKFILISAYGSADSRKRIIETKLKRSLEVDVAEHEISNKADILMFRDMNEDGDAHGQHLRETFHLADVFIDGISKTEMDKTMSRFIQAFFGRNDIAPSRNEYGMYAAKSASLRSSDLSRQVGAAIFSQDGSLITQGCNEVPRAFGGTYWDGDDPDYRDVKTGHDPNDVLKKEVVRDLMERLGRAGLLTESVKELGSSSDLVNALIKKPSPSDPQGTGCLNGSLVTDLTEYGRVVHAEMCAICDAARLGRSLKDAILFCTTFPCHNCTKHVLASGIKRVVYMEPYPKSRAKELHENEIEVEKDSGIKVSFMPFLGISPFRYRDIFQKGKRKLDGVARLWYEGEPLPMVENSPPTYIEHEELAISGLVGTMKSLPLS